MNFLLATLLMAQIQVFFGRDNLPHKLAVTISQATYSLDMAFHQVYEPEVVDSILSVYNRGVKVRIITEHNYFNRTEALRNAGIIVVDEFNDRNATDHIMHDKFMVIDYWDSDTSNDVVWNGSYNASNYIHADNAVVIQSHSLARIFEAEFNQMWGDTTYMPDPTDARTGRDKQDTAPFHTVYVNGTRIDVYFSPQDSPINFLIALAESSKTSIDFNIFYFTHMSLASAMANRLDNGVRIQGVYEHSGMYYSRRTFELLQSHGAQVYEDSTRPRYYYLHHKFMVVDDSIVETGSMNWTVSGNSSNDENIMIIYNSRIADAYEGEFIRRFREAGSVVRVAESSWNHASPLCASSTVFRGIVRFNRQGVKIVDATGRLVGVSRSLTFNGSHLSPGIYFAIYGNSKVKIIKIR